MKLKPLINTKSENEKEKKEEANEPIDDSYTSIAKKLHSKLVKQVSDDQKKTLPIKTLQQEWVGFDGDRLVFPYFNDDKSEVIGIKFHKPDPYSTKGFECTWYLGWHLKDYDTNKPLYICEGEKDAIILKWIGHQVISSSNGAGSLPDDFNEVLRFETIFIYDNDKSGLKGANKHANTFKRQKHDATIKIATWDSNLSKGHDVFDDWKKYRLKNFDKAVINAKEYELTLPKEIGAFKIMTGKEGSQNEPVPTEWLVENVLPKQFNSCLAGTTGAKKSMWAIQLGMSLANGKKKFCGNRIKAPGIKVLYVDTEIGQTELHRRYRRIQAHMNWNGDSNFVMMSKGGYHVDVWKYVHEAISIYKPELIIFDSLYNTTTVGDFSKSAQMSKVTNALTQFKEAYGVTVLAIAHFNKGQQDMGLVIDRMQGSAVLQNWVEFQMLMVSTNVDDFNLWTVAKTRGVRHDKSVIGIKWDDFWFKTKGVVEDINPFLISEYKRKKWQIVLEDCPEKFDTNQWLNVFSTKYSMSERTGRQWLKECSQSPMVKKVAHGVYEKGLRLIDEDSINE